MLPTPPLLHAHPDDIVAWRAGQPVTQRTFMAHAAQVADSFPAGRHLLNACHDRYRFAVTLVAGMLSGRVNLMPSTYTPEVVRQLAEFAPDTFVVDDGTDAARHPGLPEHRFPDTPPSVTTDAHALFAIPPEQLVSWVFTSGSTGAPVPHPKTWGKLVLNTRAAAQQLGLNTKRTGQPPFTLIGTVPPQHMYGFESTILLALQGGGAFVAERLFYPADILATLAATPGPRVLVTTPYHLRTLLAANEAKPPVELLVSATAPLPPELAREAEQAFAAPLLEIYGSTETGQIATRRPCADPRWRLFPGIQLEDRAGTTWAQGGHVETPVPLGDLIVLEDSEHFTLQGRSADLINIAGKRTSLEYLNHQLQRISGITDAAYYMPDEDRDSVTRLSAFVVAPGMTRADIVTALRERIDPLFLPRPLVMLDALPRNATGKLPRDVCKQLLAAHASGSGRSTS
jgi:acyl-coenzyme A synthetase/AMP-(fatty) acid ligase